jgi:hypothetical protein
MNRHRQAISKDTLNGLTFILIKYSFYGFIVMRLIKNHKSKELDTKTNT